MRMQRSGSWPARTVLIALLIALITLPLVPAQRISAAPVAQSDAEIANRVAEIRSNDPDIVDDFEAEDENWGRLYTGVTSVYLKSGKLHISTDQTEQIVWSRRDGSVTDFYLEVDAEFYEGSQGIEAGVIFRYVDEDNFYYFGVENGGNYVIQQLLDGEWFDLTDWGDSSVIETGSRAVNQLGLLVEGTTISVLINDYVLATIQDDTFSEGNIALSAVTYNTPSVDIAYDNVRLWALNGAPNALPVRVPQRPSSASPTPTPEADTTPTAPDDEAANAQADGPTYIETFDQEPEGWTPLVADGLVYDTQEGALDIGITRANALGWAVLPVAPNNYYIEVDTTFFGDVSEAEYGILFRYQDPQNFYLFAINNTGYFSLWRLVDNQWEELYEWTQNVMLNAGDGAENTLGLLVQGPTFTLFVNDTELANVRDPLFNGGNLALAAGTFDEPNVNVLFDNITLWSLDPGAETTNRSGGTPVPSSTAEPEEEPTPQAVPTAVPTQEPTPDDEPAPPIDIDDLIALAEARIEQIVDTQPAVQDDFNRDRGNWSLPANETSRAYLEDNALQIAVDDSRWYQSSSYIGGGEDAVDFSDFYAEVTTFFASPQPGSATGIAFRLVDVENYYLFIVDESGTYSLFVQVDGEWTTLIDYAFSDAFDTADDALNVIGVLAEGDTIALTINQEVVDVVQDATHSSGSLGLFAESADEPGIVVGFDDFFLWELE